jgi:hydrogenase-4 component B
MFHSGGIWESGSYIFSLLPIFIVAVPLAGSLLVVAAARYGDKARNALVLVVTALTVALVASLYPLLERGTIQYSINLFLEFGFLFRVDYLSFLLALLFSSIWFLISLFSAAYFSGTHAKTRFYVFFLSTLGHVMGLVVAGDLFSFFLFFELMTFSAYVLFIHHQTPKAIQAGMIYIFMGVLGGLSLLMGIFLIYHSLGTLEMVPMLASLKEAGANVPLISVFFLVGFGIKMGMVPLHIWMPKAYEGAPAVVNALSSVTMIKAGAYGLIRVMLLMAAPVSSEAQSPYGIGFVVIWLGIITMLAGAIMALFQDHSHRILAYSSISQMGYVLLGIGCAAYLGINGAMGYAGALFHMVNHAFLKGALFLIAGAIFMQTGELKTSLLRGWGKRAPFLMAIFVLAAVSMGGIPGLNGYLSKTLLHHAIVKAYGVNLDPSLWVAEKIFILTSALTICYFVKFISALSAGETPKAYQISPAPLAVKGVLTVFALTFAVIGLFPRIIYDGLILPSLRVFPYDPANVAAYLEGIDFFAASDLLSVLVVVVLAAFIYGAARRFGWFSATLPRWLSVETLVYVPVVRLAALIACRGGVYFDDHLNSLYDGMGKTTLDACKYVGAMDRSLDPAADAKPESLREVAAGGGQEGESEGVKKNKTWRRFEWKPGEVNIKNINFDSLILAFMLGLLFFVLFFFTRY